MTSKFAEYCILFTAFLTNVQENLKLQRLCGSSAVSVSTVLLQSFQANNSAMSKF